MRKTLDAIDGHAGSGGDLGDRRPGADARLDLSRTQRALHLDLDLTHPGQIAASGGAQGVVGGDAELFARLGVLQDHLFAVRLQADDSKLTHLLLLHVREPALHLRRSALATA